MLHAGFVIFVILGGFVALRWRRLSVVHVPAALWGVTIEYTGRVCPLTPLENSLRARAGSAGYSGGFIDHYVLSRLYPAGLTLHGQLALGTAALAVNVVAYSLIVRRYRRARPRPLDPNDTSSQSIDS